MGGLQESTKRVKCLRMDLPTYIEAHGDEAAAQLFGVKVRTVASWRRGERWPHPNKAREIETATKGRVSFSEIFATPRRHERVAA